MTIKTWNGSNGALGTAAAWTPAGIPGAGDVAVINSGTVLASGTLSEYLAFHLNASTTDSPTLTLADATLPATSRLELIGAGSSATVRVQGQVQNLGTVTVTSTAPGSGTFLVQDVGSQATTLTNTGTIAVINGSAQFFNFGSNATKITNNGVMSVGSYNNTPSSIYIGLPVNGTGTILVGSTGTADLAAPVGNGQTVEFQKGSANGVLRLEAPGTFLGTLKGFFNTDQISVGGIAAPSVTYASTSATTGVVQINSNATTVARFNVQGVYSASDFSLTTTDLGNGQSDTALKTTATAPLFSYYDTTAATSGVAQPDVYSGPVNYLQWQYLWSGTDSVNIAASRNNVFLRGNTGSDALVVQGGSNVIDGGGGSDFITGATGTDGGADTFFLDGRSNSVTWSTIQNFHHGDAVTIFGFNAGTSTQPAFVIDGAQGYQGATVHSELNGAGTGINASFTLTGLSLADAANKLTISSGTVGGTNYLYIQYTG